MEIGAELPIFAVLRRPDDADHVVMGVAREMLLDERWIDGLVGVEFFSMENDHDGVILCPQPGVGFPGDIIMVQEDHAVVDEGGGPLAVLID